MTQVKQLAPCCNNKVYNIPFATWWGIYEWKMRSWSLFTNKITLQCKNFCLGQGEYKNLTTYGKLSWEKCRCWGTFMLVDVQAEKHTFFQTNFGGIHFFFKVFLWNFLTTDWYEFFWLITIQNNPKYMHNRKAGQDRYICYLFIFKKEKGQKSLLHTTQLF